MSRKVDLFKTVLPYPLTICKFVVLIPGLTRASLLIESATYPKIQLGIVAIPFKGEQIYRPTVPEVEGVWKVKVLEDSLGIVRKELQSVQAVVRRASLKDQASMIGWGFKNKVNLNPLSQGSVIVYMLNNVDAPVMGFKLHGAWFQGVDAVELSNSDPTIPFRWNCSIRYSSVEECTIYPIARIKTSQVL